MSALHVVIRPCPERAPSEDLASTYGLFDLLVQGVNLTARIGEGQSLSVLGDLGHAVAHLAAGRRSRATVEFYADEEPWELGLELDGREVLVSVLRSGPAPEVAIHERRVELVALREGVQRALEEAPAARVPAALQATLLGSLRALGQAPPVTGGPRILRHAARIAPRPVQGLALGARAAFRRTRPTPHEQVPDALLERADLHSLLVRGEFCVTAHDHTAELGTLYLFLGAEQLVLLGEEVFSAWQGGRPLFRRVECGEARFAVRRGPGDGPVSLTVSSPALRTERPGITFPEIPAPAFVRAVAQFAEALAETFVAHDATQVTNLRLAALRQAAVALEDSVEDALADDSLTNPEPESYRSFALGSRRNDTRGPWEHGGKMRFLPRWVATVPGIDLSATFLCGDHILLGAARETACIHRTSGEVVWRMPTQRAVCVVTPLGLARLHADGRVEVHELGTGELRFATAIEPRSGARPSGAVVCAPGLPKLLVLTEGDRRITAIDLVSGDIRWRFTGRRPTGYRLRRAGKLLLAATDSALLALDVASGEVVWRLRDRVPFSGDLALDHDAAFAIAGSQSSTSAKLVHLDLWSGTPRWSADLSEGFTPGQPPLVTASTVVVPVRGPQGSGAQAFDRATGELAWLHGPGLVSPMAAWLPVDSSVVVNSAGGSLVCLDARTGNVRYSHVFSRPVDADQPRRLEPVLRSGALFVPQHQVHVVRPRDGELLGTVPTDLIPDLVRVDERCDVYVVEESGHVAAFGAAPRLTLVR
jgi:outer membrane protein assembly factor BamB